MRWDIFCNVIDNYGDIGVCWRLARQLAAEHCIEVRLWVDDLASLQRLCPEIDPQALLQQHNGIEIRLWARPFPAVAPAAVVIEAFGCELPENYLDAMAHAASKPVWINLEYLSAEPWVEGCHALPSPHPQLPLTKHFFFPGFTPATGGLLRENDLLTRRDSLLQTPERLWHALNLARPTRGQTIASLFSYDTAPISDLLAAWENSPTPVHCLLPEGKALPQVAAYFGHPVLAPGDILQHGQLTVQVLPFLRQEDYDLLLWACDWNFVRGEDSFVRAQWAGKPLLWQIYAQQEDAHLVKLDAFLDRYCAGLQPAAADVMRAAHHGWNGASPLNWGELLQFSSTLEHHAKAWAEALAAQPDLASNLVIFCKNRV